MLQKKQIFTLLGALTIGTFSAFAQVSSSSEKYTSGKFKMPTNVALEEFMPKTIIAKIHPKLKQLCSGATINDATFRQLYAAFGGYNLNKKFPHTKAPERRYNEQGIELVDLTLVYEFKYTSDVSLEKAINKFIALGIFEYVEPHFIPHLFYTPNDPSVGLQYHVTKTKADQAWGVNSTTARGNTSVVIGITDTGIDYTHPDLIANLKTSTTDPVGGGDQDGDGYLDNYRGWDLGENDNDATWQTKNHGVHVTGIAAASTDNATGVAGMGFNCKYLPIKISDAAGILISSYEGITYAADHGCQIINCSWGGAYGGQSGQDVITYATINKNALVVCAAGNDGNQIDGFPASFKYALSVANTQSNDALNSSSQYGYNIDVCAPGTNIYATVPGSYGYNTGTSMASPCVAGAAGIVKSFYPSYNGMQVGERLKQTCDNINSVNAPYLTKIGEGRINLYKAITDPLKPSVVMTSRAETDNNDNAYIVGDTINIRGIFTNYLAPTTNLTATISTSVGLYVTVVDGTTTLGAIPTLGTANNNNDPFKIYIKPAATLNLAIDIKVTYTDVATSYTKVEWFKIVVNVDYINVAVNDVATSITSNGKIGYRADAQTGGLGFTYMGGSSILYEASLMIAKDTSVADAYRSYGATPDADFISVKRTAKVIPAVRSDFDVDGSIKVDPAKNALPITNHHKAFAWTSAGSRKYVIVQYVLKNTSASAVNGLYAGIIADWDIDAVTFKDNRAAYDAANKMGYVYHTATNGIYGGIKLLTSVAPAVHYAIDNAAGIGGIDASNGMDGADKFTVLSTNRAAAGVAGTGGDVMDAVSTGPFNIPAGDSVTIAFALIAGDNLADLQASAANAQIKYDGLALGIASGSSTSDGKVIVYPNPTNAVSTVELLLEEPSTIELALYNVLGEKLALIASEKLPSGTHKYTINTTNLASGIYYYNLIINNKVQTVKMIVTK